MTYLSKRAAVLALAITALLIPASSALADTQAGYEEFSDCPDKAANANISACFRIEVIDGSLTLGNKTTPITDPIVLVESLIAPEGTPVVGSFDGGRQPVPGGLVGITGLDYLTWLFPLSLLGLEAEAELAGQPTAPLNDPTVLPLKVLLHNPLLGTSCRIGSTSTPITLNLTPGTTNPPPPNTPISGAYGDITPDPVLTDVFRFTGFRLVDNAFAVPGANGCSLIGIGNINSIINAQVGLPAPAGENTAIQDVLIGVGAIEAIYPPGGFE